ncbi:receptor-type adenylate cyclase [Trypanosoma cruzi cruzi]|nr:receptor-type adenylate cyclase [Trypanosoma cruzi cruzi]
MVVEWVAVWPREQRACAASRCLFFALLLLLDLPYAVAQPSGGDRVVKVVSFEFDFTLLDAFSRNIMAGFNASLHSRNNSIMNGVRVEIVEKKTEFTNYASDLSAALKADNDIFAVVGHCGDKLLLNIKDVLAERDVVAFSPFTGSSLVRGWNPNFYFLRAEPAAELLALLRYALAHLRVRRLGFMYLQGVSFGDREYAQAQRVMSERNLTFSGVFSVESSVTGVARKEVFDAAWEAFAETRPQAVIVFGSPINDTAKFVRRMLTDRRTAGAYLLAPSVLQDIVLRVWRAAVAGGVEFVPGQVITTGTNPLAKDTQYEAIQRFQEVMRAYLTHSGQKYYADKDHFLKDDGDGEMMVAGWIAGEVLSQALGSREWVKDRKSFLASLYNQRRYVVDDIVIGDYGGECKAGAASQGAACRCNQGGRTVYIKKFVESFRAVYADWGTLVVPLSECEASGLMLRGTLNGVTFMLVDVPPVSKVISELRKGFYGGRMVHNAFLLTSDEVSMQLISSTRNGAPDALRETMEAKRVDFVSGVVTEAMLEMEGVDFIDPLLLEPRPNRFRKNVIRLSPTLEQQFFVLAEYLGNASGGSVHAVIRNREASAMADVLRRSLLTFGVSLASATLLAGGDALVDHLPVEGDVFVVGLSAGDAGAIARHVSSHGGVRVFVVFLEFALLHAEFVAAFRDGAGADRVVFATSLPHWNDRGSESENARKFAAAVPREEDRTPLSLMSFAATRLVHTALSRMYHVSAEQLAEFFYNNVAVAVDDMLYGPFTDGRACPATESGAGCGRNYGATRISVWPLARALDPAVPELFPAVTPSMKYADPAAGGLTARLLIGVIACCAAALLLVAVLRYFCRGSRDNANAPKERLHPVTLVFTDIESSTALWAACPETMPDAVATHHRLIRSLIAKYRCYEVKTIGDAFMIACRSAFAAVQLVRELQQVFLQHDWGTSVIDDAYRMFEEDRAEEDAEYVPPTARLDAAVYRQYWNGLRVRVGVHTGLCDIRRDEVTKGYDYYGGTSNMAARTESVGNGGQVLLTRAAYFALSTAEREQVEVTALGAVALRGVPKPVEMYQLDTVPGRVVAGLRLDRDDGAVDDYSDCGSVSSGVSRNTCYDSAVSFISGLMSPYASRQRAGVLESLCRRWRVRMVEKGVMSYDDYCAALVERLAGRVGRVLGRRVDGFLGGSLAEVAATSAVSSRRQSRIRSFHSLGRSGSYSCTELSSVVFPVDGPEALPQESLVCPIVMRPTVLRELGWRAHVSSVTSYSDSLDPDATSPRGT